MAALPAYFVTLGQPAWEDALASARRLPPEAMPEVRLDLHPREEPEAMIRALGRRCLVTCRRREDGGAWDGSEEDRLERLGQAARCRPAWVDLEWELPVPGPIAECRSHVRLLRSAHAPEGTFDLEERLRDLPDGEAFLWLGRAGVLADNARVKAPLAWARDRELALSALLSGPKGMASRCLQFAWGGAFTFAVPDDGGTPAPGQLTLGRMLQWRCHKLHPDYGLCGVLGSPVLHSLGPAFHNGRFQAAFKDLLYLPLDCGSGEEALAALEALPILGASLTSPLKDQLPRLLGLEAPQNTLYRRAPGQPWSVANTDADALAEAEAGLAPGPVLVLGDGGVASTTRAVLEGRGRAVLQASRTRPATPGDVAALAPAGVVQATTVGMAAADGPPFPDLLAAASATATWAVEWIYKEDTAFAAWARSLGLCLVPGAVLFEAQARAQSERFVRFCGGG